MYFFSFSSTGNECLGHVLIVLSGVPGVGPGAHMPPSGRPVGAAPWPITTRATRHQQYPPSWGPQRPLVTSFSPPKASWSLCRAFNHYSFLPKTRSNVQRPLLEGWRTLYGILEAPGESGVAVSVVGGGTAFSDPGPGQHMGQDRNWQFWYPTVSVPGIFIYTRDPNSAFYLFSQWKSNKNCSRDCGWAGRLHAHCWDQATEMTALMWRKEAFTDWKTHGCQMKLPNEKSHFRIGTEYKSISWGEGACICCPYSIIYILSPKPIAT